MTFKALLKYNEPLEILTQNLLSNWVALTVKIAEQDVDMKERPDLIWWQCKEWAVYLLIRIFKRFRLNDGKSI